MSPRRSGLPRSRAALLALALLAGGCVMGRYSEGQAVAEDQIARIVPGQTTKSDVLAWFGPPQSFADATALEQYMAEQDLLPGGVVDLPFADVLVYRITEGRIRAVVLILFSYVRLDVASDTLVVFFDDQQRVLYYGWRRGTDVLDD